jgi:hypothetical protein
LSEQFWNQTEKKQQITQRRNGSKI